MDKKELKQKLKNPDFKEGYQVAEAMWRERMTAAVRKEKMRGDDLMNATVYLFNENIKLRTAARG